MALRTKEVELTWADMAARAERIAAALDVVGMRPGTRVAALADNGPSYVSLIWAAMWTGTTIVPLNTRLPDSTLSWQVQDSGATLLAVDHSARNRRLELGEVRFVQIEELTHSRVLAAVPTVADNPATLLYTSGTTGDPKLVRLTWRNHEASAVASALNLGVHPDDDWLCCLPLYHVGGLSVILRSAIYGTCVTLLEAFDVDEVLEHLRGRISLVSLVPTMLKRLVERVGSPAALAEHVRGGRLRAILLGGGAADPDFVAACLRAGLPLVQTYGMTESCSQVATMPPGRGLDKLGSSGFPLHGVEIAIRERTGEPVEHGPGVVWLRGPMITSGYVGHPVENRQRFVGGWFRTGDRGELDEDGFLWIHGRHDHVIVTGGENVSPEVVERVIERHPNVREAAVFGVADEEWGERVVAAVVADGVSGADLDGWCATSLAGYQRPREWRFVEELPRTATGKLRRAEL